jgi:hypothetical protein
MPSSIKPMGIDLRWPGALERVHGCFAQHVKNAARSFDARRAVARQTARGSTRQAFA